MLYFRILTAMADAQGILEEEEQLVKIALLNLAMEPPSVCADFPSGFPQEDPQWQDHPAGQSRSCQLIIGSGTLNPNLDV